MPGWLTPLIVVATAFAALMAFPGTFERKSRFVLHGLCAQTPEHTFVVGGQLLPFDARMTGIYVGAGITLIILVAAKVFARQGVPAKRVIVLAGLPVIALAADGFNSLFNDLGMWHPWAPTNEARLITGYGTGVAIALLLSWLVGTALYRLRPKSMSIHTSWQVVSLWSPIVVVLPVISSLPGWSYELVSSLLMVSAWTVVSMLAFVMVVLAARLDDRIVQNWQTQTPMLFASVTGLAIMLGLAYGRYWLAKTTGMPTTLYL